MSGAHQHMEHAEHTAHAGGHHASGKHIGLTMAIIGALIAFCAAMVGSERNELMRTMVEETQAHGDFTAASTKYRLVMIELEKQQGRRVSQAAGTSPAPAAAEGDKVLRRFLALAADYTNERAVTKKWADSYDPVVDAHFEAAEHYERAQLIAEIGIVVASLAVLLSSQAAWLVSLVLAVACVVQLGWTAIHTSRAVNATIGTVHHAEEAYKELRKHHAGANEDEATIEALDPGGKIRAELALKKSAASHAEKPEH